MVDDRPDDVLPQDHGPFEPGRVKRPPPTLDLSATEVPTPDEPGAADADADAAAISDPPRGRSGLFVAVLSGAVGAALMMAVAWFGMKAWMPTASAPQPASQSAVDMDNLTGRLAKLEARPMPVLPAPPDLSAVTARLDALEKSAAVMRAETTTAREQALAAAAEAKSDAAAKASPPEAATAPADLSEINARLAQLEAAAKAQSARLAAPPAKPVEDSATRRVAAAALLDAQVRQGEPYATALAAAKSLAPDRTGLAPLDVFALSGVPDAASLSHALLDMPQLAPAPSSGTSGGVIDRLRSGAAKLVTIERIDAPPTENAAFTRAAEAARRNDVALAVRDLSALPPAERAAVQPWLDRAAACTAARAASRQFADDALAALPKPQAMP